MDERSFLFIGCPIDTSARADEASLEAQPGYETTDKTPGCTLHQRLSNSSFSAEFDSMHEAMAVEVGYGS